MNYYFGMTDTTCFKKRLLYGCLLFVSGFGLLSTCTSDNEEEIFGKTDCGTEVLSLQKDIQPIIAANCAVPGCHVSGAQSPDYTNKSNIISRADEIKVRTRNRIMPPPSSGITLSTDEINKISCWVDSGAPNN